MPKFYFTFGVGHENYGKYHVIEAPDEESARLVMFDRFDREWAMQYAEDEWFSDGVSQARRYDYSELVYSEPLLDRMIP